MGTRNGWFLPDDKNLTLASLAMQGRAASITTISGTEQRASAVPG